MCQNRSRLFFRNKYTTTRLRSPINKHLSKIIVFTIRQRKIIRPKTARINIICILHPFHVQNHNYVNNTPIVLQPSSIAEKGSKHNNRPKKCTYPQVENITILPEHLFSLKKTTSRLLKRQRLCSIRVSHFPRRVSMIIFFQSKSFMRRRVRRYRLRHKIHAIKTRPNNPLHFLQRKNSIRRYLRNDLTCAARKTTFRTRKRFHYKQYTPKSKDQPFESERTRFYVRFNKSNVAMHRQTFIFLLPHQTSSINRKINHKNNQPEQSKISQSKTRPKQNITNTTSNYDKMQCF